MRDFADFAASSIVFSSNSSILTSDFSPSFSTRASSSTHLSQAIAISPTSCLRGAPLELFLRLALQKSLQLRPEDLPAFPRFCPLDPTQIKVLQVGRSGNPKVVAGLFR